MRISVDDGWPGIARVIDGDEIGGESLVLEGDLDRFDWDITQRGTLEEDCGLLVEGLDQPWIGRRTVKREIAGAVIVAGAVIGFPRTGAVPTRRTLVANGRADTAGADTLDRRDAFAEVGAAVDG